MKQPSKKRSRPTSATAKKTRPPTKVARGGFKAKTAVTAGKSIILTEELAMADIGLDTTDDKMPLP